MRKVLALAILPVCMAACGGGGSSQGADPSAYKATTVGPGSTVASADTAVTGGTIRYVEYQTKDTVMSDPGWSTSSVSATINFNPKSKQGSIQFPVLDGTELISTSDAYSTISWAGLYSTGLYRFAGNVLMGCNTSAATYADTTQVFVSSSLERVKDGAVDDLSGTTYDLFDCSLLAQSKMETLKINTDGSLYMSVTNSTIPKNQTFDIFNPEKYPAIAIANANAKTDGFYSGHAFRYGANGITRYAIVIQTNSIMDSIKDPKLSNGGNPYHYYLAIQR